MYIQDMMYIVHMQVHVHLSHILYCVEDSRGYKSLLMATICCIKYMNIDRGVCYFVDPETVVLKLIERVQSLTEIITHLFLHILLYKISDCTVENVHVPTYTCMLQLLTYLGIEKDWLTKKCKQRGFSY